MLLFQADPDRIQATLELLTGVAPLDGAVVESRAVGHPDHDRVAAWLAADAWPDIAVEVQESDGLTNVIGELPGEGPPIVLCAHWDSTATSTDGWREATDPAPGADDDASGVAVVLEAARLLALHAPGFRRTVRFVLFDGEERGLLGSTAYVDGLDEDVGLAFCLDPVGYNPGGESILWVAYDSLGADAAEAVLETAESIDVDLEVYPADSEAWGGDTRSDHAPFAAADMPALHGGSFPQPSTYHTTGDTLDVVDQAYTTEVATLAATHIAALAEPLEEAEPEETDPTGCGCATGGSPAWLGLLVAGWVRRRR